MIFYTVIRRDRFEIRETFGGGFGFSVKGGDREIFELNILYNSFNNNEGGESNFIGMYTL